MFVENLKPTSEGMQALLTGFDTATERHRRAVGKIVFTNRGVEKQMRAWTSRARIQAMGEGFYAKTTPEQRERFAEQQIERELQQAIKQAERAYERASKKNRFMAHEKLEELRQNLSNVNKIRGINYIPSPNSLSFRIVAPGFFVDYSAGDGIEPVQYSGEQEGRSLTPQAAEERVTYFLQYRGLLEKKAVIIQKMNAFARRT